MSSSAKILLGVAAVAGVAALLIGTASASATKPKGVPAPRPGPGATVETLPANTGPGLPAIKRTMWHVAQDASGQQAGVMILLQSASSPNDWALLFKNDQTGGVGLLTYSQTPIGGLIAQQLAAAGAA